MGVPWAAMCIFYGPISTTSYKLGRWQQLAVSPLEISSLLCNDLEG